MVTRGLYRRLGVPALLLALASLGWAQTPAPPAAPPPAPPAAPTVAAPVAAAPGTFAGPAQAAVQGGKIQIQVGKSTILQDVESYEISNTAVVAAQPTAEGGLILNGKTPGTTTVMVRKSGMLGIVVYEVEVTGVDIENVLKTVKAALGGIVGLQTSQEGNVVVLQGDVANRDDGVRVDHQKAVFGETILDLTKRTYLQAGLSLMKDELAKSAFREITAETQLNSKGDEVLMLRGKVYSDQQKAQLMAIALRFFDEKRIVDQVSIEAPQVEIDIEVYSFDLLRVRKIGNNDLLSQITSIESTGWNFQTGQHLPMTGAESLHHLLAPTDDPAADLLAPEADRVASLEAIRAFNVQRHTLSYPAVTVAGEVKTQLDALNQIGAVSNISTQHASVRSGQTANVQNITEQNIEIATGFAASLEQITYGQVLKISPTVLDEKRFETNVGVELSNPVGASTTVERRSMNSVFISEQGQTVILGGNKQISSTKSEDSTPFLAHIPIVNWWFRAKTNNHADTVQVFFMTLVAPEVVAATEQPQSKEGTAIKSRALKNSEDNADFLKRRHRWEAEGVKTLFTGQSRFE